MTFVVVLAQPVAGKLLQETFTVTVPANEDAKSRAIEMAKGHAREDGWASPKVIRCYEA